jgi:hypothetical protein
MRYRSSSSLSYRNVLIAAGLAVGLGVSPAPQSQPQPQSDGQSPNGQSSRNVNRPAVPPALLADGIAPGPRR